MSNDVVTINNEYWSRIRNLLRTNEREPDQISPHLYRIAGNPAARDAEERLKQARKSYANFGSDEEPLVLYSLVGNSGFVITDRALYGCTSYTLFKSKTHRLPLCDIRRISLEDRRLTVDDVVVANDIYLADLGEYILPDYLRRILGLAPLISDAQLRALNDPSDAEPFVRGLADEGVERQVLEAIIRTPHPGESILCRHGDILVTDARFIRIPSHQQLRHKATDRFVIEARLSSPHLIGHVPHLPHHDYVNLAIVAGKYVLNAYTKATHLAQIVEYTALIREEIEPQSQAIIIENNKYGWVYFQWKPTEKESLLQTADFFKSIGVPVVFRENIGTSLSR